MPLNRRSLMASGAAALAFSGLGRHALAAAQDGNPSVCGLVLLAGAGRPAGVILRDQFRAGLPEALLAPAFAVLDELEAGRTVTDTPRPHVPSGVLTGEDLRSLRFAVVTRGYSMDQVDELLDRLARQLDDRSAAPQERPGLVDG